MRTTPVGTLTTQTTTQGGVTLATTTSGYDPQTHLLTSLANADGTDNTLSSFDYTTDRYSPLPTISPPSLVINPFNVLLVDVLVQGACGTVAAGRGADAAEVAE